MAKKNTSIRIDEALWGQVKTAAKRWAKREGLPSDNPTTQWITRQLTLAVRQELGE